ncbi:MAG: general secretion pathway protein GspK [Kiritimatiellales bacterium]|nr:general secretion pathway protein GspK [Kiritimatiellales bacterium]MCF7864253.1 general secretion pathway protein GspK [Kiritimatiellales bacterium]
MNTDRHRTHRKEGSALIMVLAVAVVLAVLIADFGAGMKSELRAAGGQLEEAMNFQLARSALALARLELDRKNTSLYADEYGNAFFVTGDEDYETQIEELQLLRDGYELGRGLASYRIIYKPNSLDPNQVSPGDWHRLLEVACGIEEGDERNALVDAFQDWIDGDNIARATGAEEDFYQTLDPPRHCKNAPLDSYEELLLVYGFTPEMLYGYGNPVQIEDGMLVGGGLLRYFIGDNSPEARASAKYIVDGVMPSEKQRNREEEEQYRKVQQKPEHLYVIAQGFVPQAVDEEDELLSGLDEDAMPTEPVYLSRHIILLRLVLSKQDSAYRIEDMLENAGAETVERILAYGVPETDEYGL